MLETDNKSLPKFPSITPCLQDVSLSSAPHFATMSEDISCGPEKDVTLFQKGEIIGLHQAKKTTEQIDETTKTGLRTVHY